MKTSRYGRHLSWLRIFIERSTRTRESPTELSSFIKAMMIQTKTFRRISCIPLPNEPDLTDLARA